jgi:hypothetical protein
MNERIKELAMQSDFGYIVTDRVGTYRGGISDDDAERLTRFTQLIVRECIEVQKKCPHTIAPAKFVRDHFGVEE